MPKAEKPKSNQNRHNPLGTDLDADGLAKPTSMRKAKAAAAKQRRQDEELENEGQVIPANLSKAILRVAQEQTAELEEEDEGEDEEIEEVMLDEGDAPDVDADGFVFSNTISAEEERALGLFMGNEPRGVNLADLIMEKLDEKKQREEETPVPQGLSPKVVKVYTEIGTWLKKYRSGKLPKAFKIIPNLINWEEVLYLTNPIEWSANAMDEGTKLFASNLNQAMAQRFFNLVLLPAVREDIFENKRLNFNLYQALKRAMYKPQAWLRGILLPIAMESCTLQEAVILGSVVQKISIPTLHSAAAIIKLCEMKPWYGSTSVILTAFINKKYALPRRCIDCLVNHFASFTTDERELPVLWHQCLLVFVQRYKLELTPQHKSKIKGVLKAGHLHRHIGPEIRRELFTQAE